jgi:hypothetical protein
MDRLAYEQLQALSEILEAEWLERGYTEEETAFEGVPGLQPI